MALLPEEPGLICLGTVTMEIVTVQPGRLDSIPVLAKAGAIVTLDARTTGNKIDNPDILKVIVAARCRRKL